MVGIFRSKDKEADSDSSEDDGAGPSSRARSRTKDRSSGLLSKLLPPLGATRSRSKENKLKQQDGNGSTSRSSSPGLLSRTGRRLSWRSGQNTPADSDRDRSQSPPLGRSRSEDDLTGADTDVESISEGVVPHNAFDESEPEDDDDDGWDEYPPDGVGEEDEDTMDIDTFRNTSINTGDLPVRNILESQSKLPAPEDDHPNMLFNEQPVFFVPPELETHDQDKPLNTTPATLNSRPSTKRKETLALVQSEPLFERNRCTIYVSHGDPDAYAQHSKRIRKYLVASDLSEESQYAVEWAIGTVLRDGDEAIIVSVMETDSKLDSDKSRSGTPTATPSLQDIGSSSQGGLATLRPTFLGDRETRAQMLAKQSIAFLKRTRLHVKLCCQAIHARNTKHMLVDMIDYVEPTLVVIGSRGLTKIKGMLLGSVSYYLVQKSSVPVMVARRRLRRQSKARKSLTQLDRHARVPLSQAEIERESTAGQVQHEGQPLERTASEIEEDQASKELEAAHREGGQSGPPLAPADSSESQ